MALKSEFGAKIFKPKKLTNLYKYFLVRPPRYVIEVDPINISNVQNTLKEDGIYFENIGKTQKEYLEIEGELKISTKDLYKINNQWYNTY